MCPESGYFLVPFYLTLIMLDPFFFRDKNHEAIESREKKSKNVRHMIFLSVAYAANCGGTATLTGTGKCLLNLLSIYVGIYIDLH